MEARAKSDRKQQILATAAEILETKSFAAFSYQDLADRLGIRKPSIHHHFKSKDELRVALLKFYKDRGDALMAQIVGAADGPADALRNVFAKCEQVLLDGDEQVCPSSAFEVDAKNLSETMVATLREYKISFQKQMAELLESARSAGQIAFLGQSMDQAGTLLAAMQGAQVTEPILGRDYFRAVIAQLQRSIGL